MIILGTNSVKDTGGFQVANSCNFEEGSLHKTVSSPSATFTISVWVKLSNQYVATSSIGQRYFWTGGGAGGASGAKWNDGNVGILDFYNEGTGHVNDGTGRNYRDPSAWYHWVWKNVSGTGTLYVNGVQNGSTFSMGPLIGSGGPDVINIGRYGADTVYAPMTMAEFVYLDGTAATPSSFGEVDDDSGIWKPIDVSGLTFGTNGFHLDFQTAGTLGNDANGGTDLTKTGTLVQHTDTPTNNFATLNPLVKTYGTMTYSKGNTKMSGTGGWNATLSTVGLSTGKWWIEIDEVNVTNNTFWGICSEQLSTGTLSASSTPYNLNSGMILWHEDGRKTVDGSNTESHFADWTAGVLGMAIDLDSATRTVKFYSGGSQTGDTINLTANFVAGDFVFPIFMSNAGSNPANFHVNFGNPAYALSSAATDENSRGSFEHAPPSGYLSICTLNLAENG